MATIVEMLNQGLGGLNTPLGQLGTQLLANAGPQAGNPSGGARMGQALAGMSEMQRAQALQQYREQMVAVQQQQQQMALQQARAKQDQAQRQQQAFSDPNLQAQLGPMAKQLAAMGIDPDTILKANSSDALQAHRAAQLQQQSSQFAQQQARLAAGGNGGGGQPPGPKTPSPRQVLIEPLEDGWQQKHIFDNATGQYRPYGKKYRQYAPGKADPMQALLGEVMPDDNTAPGAAVPGLPGANAATFTKQPVQGAELLMHSSGANPMARPPSNSTADAILSGITPPDGKAVVDGILAGVTPKYGTPPKASAPPAASQPYPGAPAVGTVRKGFKYLGGNPADPKSWSKV